MRKLELYIHIPFCVRKCEYCDFLSAPAGRGTQRQYVEALKREIMDFPYKKDYEVTSVFFGGGTPSVLPEEEIADIMNLLRREFSFAEDAEISLECNPGTAKEQKLKRYYDCGINRISFGLQSADNTELKLLGRIHTWEEFLETYEAARSAGFQNINIDLMSALPGQTVSSWRKTLEKVLALGPEHISAYSLIIEEGTPFYEKYAQDAQKREAGEQPEFLPSEEDERAMYCLTEQLLEKAGMHRYEISNYAREGYACRHNIGYWDGTEYRGFGLGASSMMREKDGAYVRMQNTSDLSSYMAENFSQQERVILTQQDRMEEFMFLGLRMMEGVSEEVFEERFGKKIEEVYGTVLKKQCGLGLLVRKEGRIFLSGRGIDVSNAVMADYLLD